MTNQLIDLTDIDKIISQPHYRVTAIQRHNQHGKIWKKIYDRSHYELWEAKTIANTIQLNFLESKKNPKYLDYYFDIEIDNDLTGENLYWSTSFKDLEFEKVD